MIRNVDWLSLYLLIVNVNKANLSMKFSGGIDIEFKEGRTSSQVSLENHDDLLGLSERICSATQENSINISV